MSQFFNLLVFSLQKGFGVLRSIPFGSRTSYFWSVPQRLTPGHGQWIFLVFVLRFEQSGLQESVSFWHHVDGWYLPEQGTRRGKDIWNRVSGLNASLFVSASYFMLSGAQGEEVSATLLQFWCVFLQYLPASFQYVYIIVYVVPSVCLKSSFHAQLDQSWKDLICWKCESTKTIR